MADHLADLLGHDASYFQVESLSGRVIDTDQPASHLLRRRAIIRTSHNGDFVKEESLYPSYRAVNPDGTFQVNTDTFKQNVLGLTRNIMTMQATGEYAAAKGMAEKQGVIRPQVQAILDKLKDTTVDIEPRDVIAQQLEASTN